MWLCTKYGFFSLVKNSLGPGMALRSRCASHITKIHTVYGPFKGLPIIHTEDSDYPYRIIITKHHAADFVRWLAEGVDYENFKEAVADVVADPKTSPYMGFLHEMWYASREWLQFPAKPEISFFHVPPVKDTEKPKKKKKLR